MPIAYYGSKISPNMTKTPEGFLICHEVPINRVGIYQYLGNDLMQPEIGTDEEKAQAREFNKSIDPYKTYDVLRRPEEVFDPAALASFEGKSVTDNHPPESVTPDNYGDYERGHAEKVHEGSGKYRGYTVADLVIKDRQLIDEINNGKREISCGYTYNLFINPNGQLEQKSMRGNHVAVVEEGRAGPRVAIKDAKSKTSERGNTMATENKGGILGRMLKSFAKDESTTPEDLEKAAKEMGTSAKSAEADDDDDNTPAKLVDDPLEKGTDKKVNDVSPESEMLGKVLELLTELKTMLAPKETDDELEDLINPKHEAAETPEEEATERETGHEDEDGEMQDNDDDASTEEQEPSVTIQPEEIKEKTAADSARQAAIITRQILKKNISDPKAFKSAAKDAAIKIRAAYGIKTSNDGYSKFMSGSANAAKIRAAHDSAIMENNRDKVYQAQQNAYDAMNPNKNKGAK